MRLEAGPRRPGDGHSRAHPVPHSPRPARLAPAVNKGDCDAAVAALDAHARKRTEDNFVIVLSGTTGGKFRALYALSLAAADATPRDEPLPCHRIHGRGPATLTADRVGAFLRYSSGSRSFAKISSTQFTSTTAAVVVRKR